MKKFKLSTLLPLLALFALVGCGKEKQPEVPEVKETTPVIVHTVNELDDVYIGAEVTLPTVTANDETDGDLTAAMTRLVYCNEKSNVVTVTGDVFTCNELGDYTVEYNVKNSFNKEASFKYEFVCKDYEAPTLNVPETGFDAIYVNSQFTVPTATASDLHDATVTVTYAVKDPDDETVTVAQDKFTAEKVGDYTITYSVVNSHGKTAETVKTLKVNDYSAPTMSTEAKSIPTAYINQVITIPTVTVADVHETETVYAVAKVTLPDTTQSVINEETFVPTTDGNYKITYTYTSAVSGKQAQEIEFEFAVKNELVITWDHRMFTGSTGGVSALTTSIMEDYKNYLTTALTETPYKDCQIVYFAIEAADDELHNAIASKNPDIVLGFTSTLYQETGANISAIEKATTRIAELTTRYISRSTESDFAKKVYDLSFTDEAKAALSVKVINIAWFEHTASTQARMDAVDAALEEYLAGKGFNINVQSKTYAKGTQAGQAAYDYTHDLVVADEPYFGLNWGSNANLAAGFHFSVRMKSGIKFGSTTGRYIIDFIKTNSANTMFAFYDDIYDFLASEAMTAIYAK